MRNVFRTAALAACMVYANAASASDNFTNTATFDSTAALTASALNAAIASSSVTFQPSSTTINGNTIKNTFNNSVGVMGIVQNSGINSNVQQSIVVKVNNLTASVAH